MKQVIVFPRGQLSKLDKERLTKAGVVAVEADDPSKVVTLMPGANVITPDDILLSALAGVTTESYSDRASAMVRELHRRAKAREGANSASPTVASPDSTKLK